MPPEKLDSLADPFQKRCTTCQQAIDPEADICPADATAVTPVEHDQLLGTVFADHYEIVSILGAGGMGKVYKARHKLMRRMVAIKVVHPHLVASTGTLARFQQEAEAVSCLNHPNVVTVHDFGLTPTAYLVMDYLEGVSLAELLKHDAHLDLDRSLHIFVQMCAGLAHAHRHGVVHRDLKPSNIMLINVDGQTDLVKIVDFGIAKLMLSGNGESKHLTAKGEIFGSPLYLSPEQCQAKAMDCRSDIYSLGCIMYRTLTGHQPILGRELMECLYNHVYTAPPCFRDICPELNLPEALEAIIMKCLEKDQDKRFQSMSELKEALEALTRRSFPDTETEDNLIQPVAIPVKGPKRPHVVSTSVDRSIPVKDLADSGAKVSRGDIGNETRRAASAAEASRAASAAEASLAASAVEEGLAACAVEAERAASAVEDRLAASAAEAGRAAGAAESARATSAAEAGRAASAAEAGRAASAAEAGRAANAAEAGRAASAAEAGLAASAAEAGRVAAAAESARAASATAPGFEVSEAEISFSKSAAELERHASAAEAERAAAAAESARAASATEAGLAASATEAARAASATEAGLAASAIEAERAATAVEDRLAASAREAALAACAHEASLVASALEAGRAASAAEAGRAATAAEAGRAAYAAEVGRAAYAVEAGRVAAAEAAAAASDGASSSAEVKPDASAGNDELDKSGT